MAKKLVVEGLVSYSLSPSSPYKIAVYVPGSKVGGGDHVRRDELILLGSPFVCEDVPIPATGGGGVCDCQSQFLPSRRRRVLLEQERCGACLHLSPSLSLYPGSAVLVVTSTDVDKTGSSYYGEQGLLYLSARGDGNLVILDKKGPIYDVQWHPNSEEFCVLYGCILLHSLSPHFENGGP